MLLLSYTCVKILKLSEENFSKLPWILTHLPNYPLLPSCTLIACHITIELSVLHLRPTPRSVLEPTPSLRLKVTAPVILPSVEWQWTEHCHVACCHFNIFFLWKVIQLFTKEFLMENYTDYHSRISTHLSPNVYHKSAALTFEFPSFFHIFYQNPKFSYFFQLHFTISTPHTRPYHLPLKLFLTCLCVCWVVGQGRGSSEFWAGRRDPWCFFPVFFFLNNLLIEKYSMHQQNMWKLNVQLENNYKANII